MVGMMGVCGTLPAVIRYGVVWEGQPYYVYLTSAEPLYCTNQVFGNPLNLVKHCDYLLSDTADTDGDGVVDSLDAFPRDPSESTDTHGDGFGDQRDPYPTDANNNRDGNWVFCAPLAQVLVRYGAAEDGESYYHYRYTDGTIDCTNAVFTDPIYGVLKQCEYLVIVQ